VNGVHAAWLPSEAFRAIGARRTVVSGTGELVTTVVEEIADACAQFGGGVETVVAGSPDLVLEVDPTADPHGEGFTLGRAGGVTTVRADGPAGLLYGLFHVVRLGEAAFGADRATERHEPAMRRRMVDHWDNVDPHHIHGQVERGYAGGSLFWRDGVALDDHERVRAYARLLAA